MKVIGISGSARKDGNTAILINKVFEELNKNGIETELIQLAGQIMEPCKACWACGGQKNCVHRNDPFREILDKLKDSGRFLLEHGLRSDSWRCGEGSGGNGEYGKSWPEHGKTSQGTE